MTWLAENVIGTVFFTPSAQLDAFQPWVRIFNGSPQQFNQSPPGQPPGSQSSGIVGSYQIILTAQPGRLDLALNPAQSFGPGPATLPEIEPAITTLIGYFKKMIETQEVIRLALVVNLSKPTTDASQAVSEFMRETHLEVPAEATDLSLSVNLAKSFEGIEGKLNRICRWGTGQMQLLTFGVNGFNGMQQPVITVFHAATLQLDISTVPLNRPVTKAESDRITLAFAEEARSLISDAYNQVLVQR